MCWDWRFIQDKIRQSCLRMVTFIFFSNPLPRGEYVNLACSSILLWSDGNIFSPVRYSYLSIFLDDNADIFIDSLLIPYCNFSYLIFSSIFVISFYILYILFYFFIFLIFFLQEFFLKRKGLSDWRVVSVIKKECGFSVDFL